MLSLYRKAVIIILETFAGSFEMAVVAMVGSRVEKTWEWAAQNPVSYGSDRYIRGHRDAQWSLCRKAVIVTLETFAGSLEMAVVAMMGSRVEKTWDWEVGSELDAVLAHQNRKETTCVSGATIERA